MALNYLLSPEFQISVTSGRPNTGGWIETFIHGTREKYYCALDFSGTLHPFRIPLDSLGSNVVLAEEGRSYDVYIYNRYGSLLMSRYNIHPSSGGGIGGNITSSDGSIEVTPTETGVDLSVNGAEPAALIAVSNTLSSDGAFTFTELDKIGDAIEISEQGQILLSEGWFHYDIAIDVDFSGTLSNEENTVTVTTAAGSHEYGIDLTYRHAETIHISGEFHASSNNTEFTTSISGMPVGMTANVYDIGLHAISGLGVVEQAPANPKSVHRLLRYYTNAGDADETHPVGDWLHDLDSIDPDDPSGHPMVSADDLFDWLHDGQVFDLYEVDTQGGLDKWNACYHQSTWQDQSEWWSQYAPVPGKAVRIEFFRGGAYATPYRATMIAYIRYKDEDYMRLYEIMPGQSVWTAEYQPKLPYYASNWHNGDVLSVKQDGSGLEWVKFQKPSSKYYVAPTEYTIPTTDTAVAQVTHGGFVISFKPTPNVESSLMWVTISNSAISSAFIIDEYKIYNNDMRCYAAGADRFSTTYTRQSLVTPHTVGVMYGDYNAGLTGGDLGYAKSTILYTENSVQKVITFTIVYCADLVDDVNKVYSLEAHVIATEL